MVFVDPTDSLYKCKSCQSLLHEPYQLLCGRRQCKTCVQLTENVPKCMECEQQTPTHPHLVCATCERKFDLSDNLTEHTQKGCNNAMIFCALKEYGCSNAVYQTRLREHYLTETHQRAIISFIMQLQLQPTKETTRSQMQNVNHNITSSPSETHTFNDNIESVSNEVFRVSSCVDSSALEWSSLQPSIEEQGAAMDDYKPNRETMQQEVDDTQFVSYNGTLIWKITSFREKMMDAQSERQTSIYSPPFYSSPTGYKMCACFYLNGDDDAERTHMSLYFVLMRGAYDAVLKFPFNYKVTFCLYDQTPQQRHIIDSFRPDIKSNSFQRPRSEMNIASGIPKFFPLTMIQQEGNPYVLDDTMFIKVVVDFDDLPKTLLPYALSLNPGLPMHVQQTLIKQEIERRAQQQTPTLSEAESKTTIA